MNRKINWSQSVGRWRIIKNRQKKEGKKPNSKQFNDIDTFIRYRAAHRQKSLNELIAISMWENICCQLPNRSISQLISNFVYLCVGFVSRLIGDDWFHTKWQHKANEIKHTRSSRDIHVYFIELNDRGRSIRFRCLSQYTIARMLLPVTQQDGDISIGIEFNSISSLAGQQPFPSITTRLLTIRLKLKSIKSTPRERNWPVLQWTRTQHTISLIFLLLHFVLSFITKVNWLATIEFFIKGFFFRFDYLNHCRKLLTNAGE